MNDLAVNNYDIVYNVGDRKKRRLTRTFATAIWMGIIVILPSIAERTDIKKSIEV